MKQNHQSIAVSGEEIVVQKLLSENWAILGRNVRFRGSEIDIIARKKKTLIFVEVKSTTNPRRFSNDLAIEELLGPKKRNALVRGASRFLENYSDTIHLKTFRFDLVLVNLESLEKAKILRYIPNAFEYEEGT